MPRHSFETRPHPRSSGRGRWHHGVVPGQDRGRSCQRHLRYGRSCRRSSWSSALPGRPATSVRRISADERPRPCSVLGVRRPALAGRRMVDRARSPPRGWPIPRWIDLLAFDPSTGSLVVIEIKTRVDDIGAVERQLGWYERSAPELARERGWAPRSVRGVLLVLASEEVERTLHANRDALGMAFPRRDDVLRPTDVAGRGLALIDPRRRRGDWLMRSRLDGRRSVAPYSDYADAATRLGA